MNECRICNIKYNENISLVAGGYTELFVSRDKFGIFIAGTGEGTTPEYYLDYCPECGKRIAEQEEDKEMSKWINIKDGVPKHCQEVIVCWNNFASCKREIHAATYSGDFGYFYIHKAGLAVKDITHWMPLPEPPKE